MFEQSQPGRPKDSLDYVELVMAIEEGFDMTSLLPAERDQLIHEIMSRIERGEFGDYDDLDIDGLAALVRKLGPRGPRGQAGATAQPEEPFFE